MTFDVVLGRRVPVGKLLCVECTVFVSVICLHFQNSTSTSVRNPSEESYPCITS